MRKYGVKLLITPAKSKVKILREKIGRIIQSAKAQTQLELLRQLNPRLRGWANYYRNGAAKRTFDKLDWYVFCRIWRWVSRRHPDKARAWKKRKYFSAAGDSGSFSASFQTKQGESRVLQLYRLASTKIERHIKVKGEANPYDSRYTQYFERRRCFLWRVRWTGWNPATDLLTPSTSKLS